MKGVGSREKIFTPFHNHAHELYRRHHPQILIIVEPCFAEDRAQEVIDTLLYSHSQRIDSIGFSGGIWMLWNEGSNLKVGTLTTSEYSIHALVKVPIQSHNFLLTVIYAFPNFNKKKILWNYLKILAPSVNLPWVLFGDFNDMLVEDEKMGGLPLNGSRLTAFRDCINQCGLMDLGFHGPRFTWTNKNSICHRNIKESLDRGLGNSEWKIHFPRTEIHHLPRTKSDHCPILMDTDPPKSKSHKPFKFEQIWLTDPSFSNLVKKS